MLLYPIAEKYRLTQYTKETTLQILLHMKKHLPIPTK